MFDVTVAPRKCRRRDGAAWTRMRRRAKLECGAAGLSS